MGDDKILLMEYTTFRDYDILYDTDQSILESSYSPIKSGGFIVGGILQRKNSKNQNGRVYPSQILERAVDTYVNTEIAENRALGELDHPESNVVNLRNVSHIVRMVEWKDDELYGVVEILPTPSGKIVEALIKNNVAVGISSRGLGSVKKIDENTDEVQDDFELIAWDFVSNPSTQQAFMKPQELTEGINRKQDLQYAHELIRDIICELSGNCCLTK